MIFIINCSVVILMLTLMNLLMIVFFSSYIKVVDNFFTFKKCKNHYIVMMLSFILFITLNYLFIYFGFFNIDKHIQFLLEIFSVVITILIFGIFIFFKSRSICCV